MENKTRKTGGLREFARFAQATGLAMAVEMASFVLLERMFDALWGRMPGLPGEKEGALGSAIAFLVSSITANALSFTLNRKRTFHSQNSLGYAVSLYVVYSIFMIALQTALGPRLESALDGVLGSGAAVTAKALMMGLSFCVSYPVNKFVIMRPTSRKTV